MWRKRHGRKFHCPQFNSSYRPQRSWGKVMFLQASVILLTGGSLPQFMLGYHQPPGADTPLDHHTPPDQAHPPGSRLPQTRHPPSTEHAGRYSQHVGGTHPTGMQSCYQLQRSCGQGYVFTRVCDSVHRRVSSRENPPGRETLTGRTPQQREPPFLAGRPPSKEAPQQGDPPAGRPPSREPPPAGRPLARRPPQGKPPWQGDPQARRPPHHTVNERPLRILLECILV